MAFFPNLDCYECRASFEGWENQGDDSWAGTFILHRCMACAANFAEANDEFISWEE